MRKNRAPRFSADLARRAELSAAALVSTVMSRAFVVFPLALALLSAGCVRREAAGPELSEDRSVPLGGAESAGVRIELAAGELRLEGGADALMDANFHYTGDAARPSVAYEVTGARGYLTVRQPPLDVVAAGNRRDLWDLRLNDRVPLDLRVNLGAGRGEFKLGGTSLRRLNVEVGAGELTIDLTGAWEQDLSAQITGGVGEATVRFPRETGVRVRARGGIGGIAARGLRRDEGYFVNDAYERPGPKLRVEITGGIGRINLIG
jgi:hypothetical protein